MEGLTDNNIPAKNAPPEELRVLVVDDDLTNRLVLSAILANEGYQVLTAENGAQAIEVFETESPDLVMMDVMMPGMDGYEAARRIKALCKSRFVPIIFLTSLTDAPSLARCIACGGDDFLTKPYNRLILKARIDALMRMRALYNALQARNAELSCHHERLRREHEIAERVFSSILQPSSLNFPGIKYLLSPLDITNGDVLLVAKKPDGGYHYLLGDFTGHGLSAAIGAMPLSEIFHAMSHKGYHIAEIAAEINRRLHGTLPTGLFCAACLVEFDVKERRLAVWNGGVPDVLLVNDGQIRKRVASRHLPLGVLPGASFDTRLDFVDIEAGDRLYVYSDGVIEASNQAGGMFGQQRLEQALVTGADMDSRFATVCEALKSFTRGARQEDDITLLEVATDSYRLDDRELESTSRLVGATSTGEWRFSLSLDASALARLDPVPNLVQMLVDIQGLEQHRQCLFMILTELYNNALEHGVLKLDSSLKQSPEGFGEYYDERERRLRVLREGWIRMDVEHHPQSRGGRFRIRVEDSGDGFDPAAGNGQALESRGTSGRGIALVDSLCDEVSYPGKGNCVVAQYVWGAGDEGGNG